ncbi:MAG: carbohydrate ABC transporter permease [Kiritimatiellae bacterium]|nr:carbohydrate ABC transporter permease [Kiritimatiellia bacterium]
MAVLLKVERGTFKARVFLTLVYAALSLGGLTMVWPFLVMFASSLTGPYDYYRFSPVPRALWNRDDRFMRYVASCYPRFPSDVYPEAPAHWGSWLTVARDRAGVRRLASTQLAALDAPGSRARWRRMAADYAEFNRGYDISNSVCNFDARDVAGFASRSFEDKVRQADPAAFGRMGRAARRQAALDRLNREWLIRYDSFFGIRMTAQQRAPLHHAGWDYPADDPKTDLYQDFKRMYRERAAGPMSRTVPFESRPLWLRHLKRPDVQERLGFPPDHVFTPADYARLAGHPCASFAHLPFPLPADAPERLRAVWDDFVREAYPRRLLRVRPTQELDQAYQAYVREICKTPGDYARLTERALPGGSFDGLRLPEYANSTLWRNFIPRVPLANLRLLSAEQAWQRFLLGKYGALPAVNRAYGWDLTRVEEARLPLREAMAVTFRQRGWRDFIGGALANYRTVGEYLFLRGQAFGNTLLLVALAVAATLTVNPLAAYALSRFGMRATEKVLLFLLATMAFPAAVTAIPGFLLIRDLGLLNTFAALVLPTLANGMSIFILKGFFDGLPRELYEAAAIDGAKEWQIFLRITLPMTTPILAVNALHAFVHAYNSWEWALLVCQRPARWTLAVWMYQMSQQLGDQPWAVMAGFVLVSIPTALVFIACQKIIMRGIVLPSMK